MKAIVGLGNPGKKYENTRHNIGFMVIDELYRRFNVQGSQKKFNCEFTTVTTGEGKLLLVKPLTFMNLSGEGVRPLLDYFSL